MTALREIYRVLIPGGRLVLSVWGPIERSPGFAVLAEALTRHIGPDAGAIMTTGPFSLNDAEDLRAIVAEASFKDVTIHSASLAKANIPRPKKIRPIKFLEQEAKIEITIQTQVSAKRTTVDQSVFKGKNALSSRFSC